jgi:hypothetical protein
MEIHKEIRIHASGRFIMDNDTREILLQLINY